MRTISKQHIQRVMYETYEEVKDIKEGTNADYIPFLAGVDTSLFAISITLGNGECIEIGDSNYVFGIESISKVLTAALVIKQHGTATILEKIGADATGLPFNSVMAILLENDHPSTPLVNAGAISACSLIKPIGKSGEKWNAMISFMEDLCGSPLELLEDLYKSETETNYNNRAIAWLLKNFERIYDDPDVSLDLYTRQCSLGVTTRQLSVCGATIAFGGHNPITHKQVFSQSFAAPLTSLVSTVGFYERTGDWLYTSGIPAKTGVGGGIMGIMPGVMGISAFSPPLDESGNSVRAQLAIQKIMNRLELNIFAGKRVEIV